MFDGKPRPLPSVVAVLTPTGRVDAPAPEPADEKKMVAPNTYGDIYPRPAVLSPIYMAKLEWSR